MKYVYRVVNGLLGFAVLLVAYTVNFFRIEISTGEGLEGVIGSLNKAGYKSIGLYEDFSIKRFVDLATGKDPLSRFMGDTGSKPIYWPEKLHVLNVPIIIFAVAFILMLVVGIFLIVWSCFSNKRIPVLIAGVMGVVFNIVMLAAFSEIYTTCADGKVDLIEYFIETWLGSGLLSSIAGYITGSAITLDFALCGLQNAFFIVFFCVVIWTALFYLVEIGDPKAKEEKEREKKEKEAKKAAKAAKKQAKKA